MNILIIILIIIILLFLNFYYFNNNIENFFICVASPDGNGNMCINGELPPTQYSILEEIGNQMIKNKQILENLEKNK